MSQRSYNCGQFSRTGEFSIKDHDNHEGYIAILVIGSLHLVFIAQGTSAEPAQAPDDKLTQEEATKAGVEAYIYGYPLVTMETTRRIMTNVATVPGMRGPMGSFINARAYPTAAFRDVTAPNADTLYSTAWLDLGKEPYILSLPDEADRYYLMPMLSGWTDVFRGSGQADHRNQGPEVCHHRPRLEGELPDGITEYKSPTSMVWILGRTYCTGTPQDYKAVHALQDQVFARPAKCLQQAIHARHKARSIPRSI